MIRASTFRIWAFASCLAGSSASAVRAEWSRDSLTELASRVQEGDSTVWIALPVPPPEWALSANYIPPGIRNVREFYEDDSPILIAGLPDLGSWRVVARREDAAEVMKDWMGENGFRSYPLPYLSSGGALDYGVELHGRFENPPRDAYFDVVRLTTYEEADILSVRLSKYGFRERYRQARERIGGENPPPLSGTESWSNAMLRFEPDSAAIAGFDPGQLIAGFGNRIPASNTVARLFAPDGWHGGWANARAGVGALHVRGGWKGGGETMLADSGGHSLLGVAGADASLVVALKLRSVGVTMDALEAVLLESEYGGRDDLLQSDVRAFDRQIGFSLRQNLIPLLGDEVLLGFTDSSPDSWTIVFETPDAPLMSSHVAQAVERTVGGVVALDSILPVRTARNPETGREVAWASGDGWLAISGRPQTLVTFTAGAADERFSLRAELSAREPGWETVAGAAPLFVHAKPSLLTGHPASALAERVCAGFVRDGEDFRFDMRIAMPNGNVQDARGESASLR